MEAVNGWFYVLRLKCNMESDPFIQLQWVNCFYSSYFCFLFHEQLPVLVILHDGMVSVNHGWEDLCDECRRSSSLLKRWSGPVSAHLSWSQGRLVIRHSINSSGLSYWPVWLKSTEARGCSMLETCIHSQKDPCHLKRSTYSIYLRCVCIWCACARVRAYVFRRGVCTVYILAWKYV